MAPSKLVVEIGRLRDDGWRVELHPERELSLVLFHDYPLPEGYNKTTTRLLLKIPQSYPNGKPDMFWTDSDLTLADGSLPKQAQVIQTHLNSEWRRFSWHAQSWNPGSDDLYTYLEFVDNRLSKAI